MPAKFRIEISPSAKQDIVEIWEEIAQDHPATAARFIRELEKQMHSLREFPLRCPLIPEEVATKQMYRHLIYGNYRTIFCVVGATVRVSRVIHGARLLDLEDPET